MSYRIFGNKGEYVMPHTPEFDTRESAREYARHWFGIDNRYIYVRELDGN